MPLSPVFKKLKHEKLIFAPSPLVLLRKKVKIKNKSERMVKDECYNSKKLSLAR